GSDLAFMGRVATRRRTAPGQCPAGPPPGGATQWSGNELSEGVMPQGVRALKFVSEGGAPGGNELDRRSARGRVSPIWVCGWLLFTGRGAVTISLSGAIHLTAHGPGGLR